MQTVKGKVRLTTRAGVNVNGRPSPCFSPVTGWRPVRGVPRLSPNNPELYKQKMVDRMIEPSTTVLVSHVAPWKNEFLSPFFQIHPEP